MNKQTHTRENVEAANEREKEVKKTQRPNARIARIRFRTEADTHTGRRSPGNHSNRTPGSSKVAFALLKHYVLALQQT